MIDTVNSLVRVTCDAALSPFRHLNSWVGMAAVSLLTACLMLIVYRLTSDQEGIRAAKDKIVAHLLEARLFRNDLGISFRAQGNILRHNLKYLGHSLRPMLVMIVPLGLALAHLDQWFGYQSLHPGETAIVKVRLKEGYRPSLQFIPIDASPGFTIETPPLRIDREAEIDWRLRAEKSGSWTLNVLVNNEAVAKQLVVGAESLARISPSRVARGWIDQLASPGESAIPDASPVRTIEIIYPSRSMTFLGWHIHWLFAYFVLSIILGFVLKSPFKVDF